ncbi:MAG: type VI secretion system baseplate subunit TssF [Blastocatellia bacterium]|nr:MAG: type VI secretion system baseplate subunit TssF [Blastocatellia bacterium]
MRDELLGYYERELAFVRQMGAEFARKYPKIAGRLSIEGDKCEDPHVERLIEAFAFLAGRVRLKVDDEFPEITESFLNVLYPHYLAPIPSMAIVRFTPKEGSLTSGFPVPKGTGLYSRPIQGTPCRFRTGYDTTVWPIQILSASLESLDPVDTRGRWNEAVIKISLSCMNETSLRSLRLGDRQEPLTKLRFYLNGEPQVVYPLYEMLFNHATRVEIKPGPLVSIRRTERLEVPKVDLIKLPASAIKDVGFELDHNLLQYEARSFPGYRLLSEYFALPEKFLFFDLEGFDKAAQAGFSTRFDVHIYLKNVQPIRGLIDASTFQLGCTPIINLFSDLAEPIRLSSLQYEYQVVSDVRRPMALEVYSVDKVVSENPQQGTSREFKPFYSIHHSVPAEEDSAFWYASRRQSQKPQDEGTEVFLTLVDMNFNPHVPATSVLSLHVTCTNRDLPAKLPFGGAEGNLEAEGAMPISGAHCLTKPTPTLRPPLKRSTQWRLISHLALNHLSLVAAGSEGSPEALQEILSLYDFLDSSAVRRQIKGLKRIQSKPSVRQIGKRIGAGFVRGLETTIEFDEEQYVGSGLYLFASVLERFLGLYASVNSFNELVATTSQREGILKRWPPRAGQQILL